MTCTAEAMATSRSEEVPPVRTVSMGQCEEAQEVSLCEVNHGMLGAAPVHLLVPISCWSTSYRLTIPISFPSFRTSAAGLSRVSIAPTRSVGALGLDHGERRLHHLAHRAVEQRGLGQRLGHQRALDEAADTLAVLDHRDLAHAPGAHQVERLPHRRRRARR